MIYGDTRRDYQECMSERGYPSVESENLTNTAW